MTKERAPPPFAYLFNHNCAPKECNTYISGFGQSFGEGGSIYAVGVTRPCD